MTHFYYRLLDWLLRRYMRAVVKDNSPAWKLIATLHFMRRWAAYEHLDFDAAVNASNRFAP